MPGGSKKAADAALVAHLAAGVSPAAAAKLAGVSEATAYRRLADPDFRQRVEKARSDFWDRALGIMSNGAAESAIVLRKLLRSDDERIKLQAAKTLLEQGIKVRDLVDTVRRVEKQDGERGDGDAAPMGTTDVVRLLAGRLRQLGAAELPIGEKSRLTATLADALLRAIGVDVIDKRLEALQTVLKSRKGKESG
ncbi:MAG TPA: hypothetical protein VH575_28700 [Gemmataceae bacterium]|jgi:hypothetical protein